MQEDDDFLASVPGTSDQQVLAQEQTKSSAIAPAVAPLEDDSEVTFDANKVTLQIPDRLFGPSFTAVNGISQAIGNVIQVTIATIYTNCSLCRAYIISDNWVSTRAYFIFFIFCIFYVYFI